MLSSEVLALKTQFRSISVNNTANIHTELFFRITKMLSNTFEKLRMSSQPTHLDQKKNYQK